MPLDYSMKLIRYEFIDVTMGFVKNVSQRESPKKNPKLVGHNIKQTIYSLTLKVVRRLLIMGKFYAFIIMCGKVRTCHLCRLVLFLNQNITCKVNKHVYCLLLIICDYNKYLSIKCGIQIMDCDNAEENYIDIIAHFTFY